VTEFNSASPRSFRYRQDRPEQPGRNERGD